MERQPEPNDQIRRLVDPSLFPLVYGRSFVLAKGGHVDLQDLFGSYKGAEVAPKHVDRRVDSLEIQKKAEQRTEGTEGLGFYQHFSNPEFYFWSSNYQWLPFEVEFSEGPGTEVRITSYINNIHPAHGSLYESIEKLVSLAIKPWNDCLIPGQNSWGNVWNIGQRGPVPMRILTHGVEWENTLPEWALEFRTPLPSELERYYGAQQVLLYTNNEEPERGWTYRKEVQGIVEHYSFNERGTYLEPPPSDSELWDMAKEYLKLPEDESGQPVELPQDWDMLDQRGAWSAIRHKHSRLLRFKHPEPGTTFSYQDWKAGNNNTNIPIIEFNNDRPEWKDAEGNITRSPIIPDYKAPRIISLQDEFRRQGLQVIVQVDSIELTPENPTYSTEDWQLDGQLNEHIVAGAIFAYDALNITEPLVSFRQESIPHDLMLRYREEFINKTWHQPAHKVGVTGRLEFDAIAHLLGYYESETLEDLYKNLPFQKLGSVAMLQGRLIAFPAALERRIEPFQLENLDLPGHLRFVKLYLVDPHYRVCSTRNVPPQQHHWWEEAMSNEIMRLGVPREIATQIIRETDGWPMTMEEARKHRQEMMKEHRWHDLLRRADVPGT